MIIGIGASAGGLDACQRFLQGAPADAGFSYIVVFHLAPSQESHVAEILQRGTRLRVSQVAADERIEPNCVYVIAPATSLGIRDGVLEIGAPAEPHYLARPIDSFLSALALEQKERAVGIVLSGTGNDGSAGLEAIRSAGGLALAQDPETAEFDGMPQSAMATGALDTTASPEEMGEILLRFAASPSLRPPAREARPGAADAEGSAVLPEILALLGRRYRVDFRDYKIGTLQRRTERRIALQQCRSWASYRDFLAANPGEVDELYNDLLIGVTSFFRDPEEWSFLDREIVPRLIRSEPAAGEIRLWSAGCATGEEAYSLGILVLEHLEASGLRRKLKVFASDASEEALAVARRGYYPPGIAEQVSEERLRRYFRRSGEGYEVERTLREAVTFANHDLISDPPFAHLDLVACRNLLIYLETPAQERLIELLHFALRPEGTLWLGASETVSRRSDLFEALGKHRIYRAVKEGGPGRYRFVRRKLEAGPQPAPPAPAVGTETAKARLLEKMVLYRHTKPCVVIDKSLQILYSFGRTEDYLSRPLGEARSDLLSWVRPEIYAKLRGALAEAIGQARAVTVAGMRMEREGGAALVEAAIEPITSVPRLGGLFLVAFRDLAVPGAAGPAPACEEEEAALAQVQQELQDTREELRAAVEQLRVATEDHSGSYEEVLSLNEEFQASNEELEASKEELQSLNEELTTINRQLEDRNEELNVLTSDLNNLLVSARIPTIFLDREFRIRRFTPACSTLMRVAPSDLGRPISDLKMQVLDDALLADSERALVAPEPVELEVKTDDGRWFLRRLLPYRTAEGEVDGVCLTYHEITVQKEAMAASEMARLYAEAIIRSSRTPLIVLAANQQVVSANAAFYETYQVTREEAEGRSLFDIGDGQWNIAPVRALLEETVSKGREIRDYDVDHLFPSGWRCMRLNSHVLRSQESLDLLLLSIEDVTDLRRNEIQAKGRAEALEGDDQRKNEFLAMLGHELRNPLSALLNGLELLRHGSGEPIEPTRAMMERQTRRMSVMLDQLLDVARVVTGKFHLEKEAADITEAAQDAIESITPLLEGSGHAFDVSLPPTGTVFVLGDILRLAQVIENLLGNAIKYTPPGGRVWLRVDASETQVKISVRDSGIGLDTSLLEGIFDLFTQAPASLQRAKGGLGLGLALVRNLVQMHGGGVEARSAEKGQGSEFVVTLPRLHQAQLVKALPKKTAPEGNEHRILVVDDEVDSARTLTRILTLRGHDARWVPDGISALTILREFHPEVVFLDLGLPAMDGFELAARLRAILGPQVPLVALTGYRSDDARLREANFDAHFLKPAPIDKLLALIAKLDSGERPPL